MEIWNDIKGFEGLYKVSSLGRIKSLERMEICGGRAKQRIRRERILKPNVDRDGYLKVVLCKNSQTKQFTLHRIVMLNFKENPLNKPCINHIDGNKQNNYIENLEWVTIKENNQHSNRMGLAQIGERHYKAKLTLDQVLEIKKLHKQGLCPTEIAKIFSISDCQIGAIIKGRSWKNRVLLSEKIY